MVNKKSGAARRKAQQARTAAPSTSSSSSGPASPPSAPTSNGATNGTAAEEDKMDIDEEGQKPVEPSVVEQAEKAKEQGNLAFKAGKHSEAVRHYTSAIDLVSSSANPAAAAPYHANRAAASMSLKLYPAALSDMQSSLSLSPPPPPPKNLLRLARCQLATAQTGPARSTLTSLLSTPLASDATKELARVDAVESAVASIQAARTRDEPSMVLIGLDRLSRLSDGGLSASTDWTCWRIEALLAKSRLNEASDAVTSLLRSSGGDKNPEAWWWRGLVLFHQANFPQSVKAFQESLRLDPDLTKSRTMMRFVRKLEAHKDEGNKAFKSGDTDLAIEKYSSATSETLPEIDGVGSKMPVAVRTTLLSNTSAALLKRRRAGDFDLALTTADEILALDPDHFKALRTKGRARVALAKEGDENDGDGSSQQARVQKWEDAVRDLEQAEEKAPTDEERSGLKKEIKDAKTELKKAKAKDYYKILGVSRTADESEIKRAFKKQSLQHHPDKGGDEEKFKEINEAFSVLSDPQKRRMVDQGIDPNDPTSGHEGMGGFDMGGGDGIPVNLADLFGGGGGGGFRFASAGGSPFGGGMGGSPFGGMGGSPFGAAGGSRGGGGGSPFGFQF